MRQQAERLELGNPDMEEQTALRRYRDYLNKANEWIRRYHRSGGSGLRVVHCRSIAMDVLIEHLFHTAMQRLEQEFESSLETVSLLALGGYGRLELCPHSDIDIMFLYPDRPGSRNFSEKQKFLNDTILYKLWDIGLKVGHSTRTIRESIEVANDDVHAKNAMLESRIICGSTDLGKKFSREYNRFIQKDNAATYIRERLEDQENRRTKHAGTVFLQEPEIKSGVGGLRDYQNILWMARLKMDSRDLQALVSENLLRQKEHDNLVQSYDFLLRVRNELHFQSRRPTDILNLEKQPRIAWHLNYRQHDIFNRVEAFMRDYYRAAQTIFHLSQYLERRLALDSDNRVSFKSVLASRRLGKVEKFDGFIVRDGSLFADNNRIFDKDPVRLIRVFRHLQRLELNMDFDLERLIERKLDLINGNVIHSAEANRCFRAILQSKGNVYHTLLLMNTMGVLSRFMPEWAALNCLVQHEHYHRYTADEHILNTIRELDRIFSAENPELSEKYRDALEATELPALLYITLLLHDIGKAQGIQNHADVGAEMADAILKRMGVVPNAREKILFLIKHHLEMARFWQRYDVDDPQTTSAFAEFVENTEQLRYLYVLTFCDTRGTKQDLWNSYKDTLHTQLFQTTRKRLKSAQPELSSTPMISKDTIKRQLPDISEEEIEAHFNLLPDRYFNYHNEEEILLHLRMVNNLLKNIAEAESVGSLVPAVEWRDDLNLGLTEVHIVTWDRAGLFYKLAAAFTLAGVSIVSSKALSRADHITIDTFYVSEPNGGVVKNQEALNTFQRHLKDALVHNNKDFLSLIQEKAESLRRPSYLQNESMLPASIPPRVDVYHELSLKRTIIEIEANDEIGFLYRVTRAIFDHGFDISFARISTDRRVAVDTFYIEPIQPGTEQDSEQLINLRQSLMDIVEASANVPNEQ